MRARVGVRVEVRVGVRIRGFAGEGEDHDLQRLSSRCPCGQLCVTRVGSWVLRGYRVPRCPSSSIWPVHGPVGGEADGEEAAPQARNFALGSLLRGVSISENETHDDGRG